MIPVWMLSPLGRKIMAGAALALTFMVLLRWYGNRQYAIGRDEERVATAAILQDAVNKAREEALAALQKERDEVAAAQMELGQAREQFAAERRRTDTQMQRRLDSLAESLKEGTNRVVSTQDRDLVALIRSLNGELRGARPVVPGGVAGDSK